MNLALHGTPSEKRKYGGRPGPPFPANAPACRGKLKPGNNGQMYRSKLIGTSYRWTRVR